MRGLSPDKQTELDVRLRAARRQQMLLLLPLGVIAVFFLLAAGLALIAPDLLLDVFNAERVVEC